MKKTNFFKLLMVGAAALSLGFAGCNNASEADLEAACKEIDALKTDVQGLKDQLAALGYVTKVQLKSGTTNVLEVFTNGKAAPDVITIEGGSGGGTVITEKDGNWWFGDKDSGYPVGGIGATYPPLFDKESGCWSFYNETEKKYVVDKNYPAIGSYATAETATSLSLYLWKDGELKEFKLAKYVAGAGGVGKIDIIGWITGKGAANENISISTNVKNGTNDAFTVNYAWIEKFYIDTNNTKASSTMTDVWKSGSNEIKTWEGTTKVVVNNVLNTLGAERKGLLIQVHPASTPVADIEDFIIQNSQSGVLPLKMQTPELVTGLLTRAATESAYWFIPWTYENSDVVYLAKDKGTTPTEATGHKQYHDKFKTDAIYSLVLPDGNRSEYTPFTFTPQPVVSFEAAVKSVINGTTPTAIGTTPAAYKVVVGKDYSIGFDVTTKIPVATAWQTDWVVDYYMVVQDNNEYVQDNFNVTFNKEEGKPITFRVNKLPDNLTLATFTLRVYKLGVDGKVYIEDIEIYPVRDIVGNTVREGNYPVVDTDKKTGNKLLSDRDNKGNMEPMFTTLAGIQSGNNMTLKERWQNVTYGAKYWELTGVKIGGKAVNGQTSGYKDGKGTIANPTLAQWKTMFYTDGTATAKPFVFTAGNGAVTVATGTNPDLGPNEGLTTANANLYNARYIQMNPAYVRQGGTLPMFDIGSEYELTFEFYDSQKNYLSSATYKFIPTIPALNNFFEKYPKKWNDDLTTLMAYYESPGTWADDYFYNPAQPFTGAATSTYYNVYATTADIVNHKNTTPYDGGFLRFGTPAENGKEWIDDDTTLAYQLDAAGNAMVVKSDASGAAKYADYYTNIGAVAGINSVIELINQTPAADSKAIAYDTDLAMTIHPGNYLGVYDYADYESTKAQLDQLDFNLRLMSAVDKGTIKGSGADGAIIADIDAASVGDVFQITDAHFSAYNYNNTAKYSLFTVDGTKYQYTYINEVQFFIPAGEQTYTFADADGDMVNSTTAEEIWAQAVPASGNNPAVPAYGYVAIKARNTFQTSEETKIGVQVIDRFGKTKKAEIKIKITVH